MESFLHRLPKVELHLHLEGTMEPELMFKLARRNNISVPFQNADELRQAYTKFTNLQSFLDLMEIEEQVLITSEDFYELAWEYFQRASFENVRHCEVFIDVQAHLSRGVTLQTQFDGLRRAFRKAENELNMTTGLIICFMRDKGEQAALETLDKLLEFRDDFIGIGLDSTDIGNPPSKFIQLYQKAHQHGLHCVAHVEESPASYVKEAIDLLRVERIDHGINCVNDPILLQQLSRCNIPLTVCPLSNLRLNVVKKLDDIPLKILLKNNIKVTINSDCPPYFGGYILTNFIAIQNTFQLSKKKWIQLTENAIYAAFISEKRRQELLKELKYVSKNYRQNKYSCFSFF